MSGMNTGVFGSGLIGGIVRVVGGGGSGGSGGYYSSGLNSGLGPYATGLSNMACGGYHPWSVYQQPDDGNPAPLLKQVEKQEKEKERMIRLLNKNKRLVLKNYILQKRIDCLTGKSKCPACLEGHTDKCFYDLDNQYVEFR